MYLLGLDRCPRPRIRPLWLLRLLFLELVAALLLELAVSPLEAREQARHLEFEMFQSQLGDD